MSHGDIAYVIDLDGTLYRGEEPVEGAAQFMEYLRETGKKYLLATNCPSRTQAELVKKLESCHICVKEEEILTSGMTAAYYLKDQGFQEAFVIGEEAVRVELQKQGIRITERNPMCVLVSFDRGFTYDTLNKALQKLRTGIPLICTNCDNVIPSGSQVIPHTGAICAAIERASGVKAVYLGKPEEPMAYYASKILGLPYEKLCVIGDRLDTDIMFANKNGMKSVLTLTGCGSRADITADNVPDVVVSNLMELADWAGKRVKG